ncbi:MAG: hypothetical protein QM726_09260 [Chitinophagaceae bacterium]
MAHPKEQMLIDYLDNNLPEAEKLQAEQLLREDPTAATELDSLNFSVELIREAGVMEQVKEARLAHENTAKVVTMPQKSSGGVVRTFNKMSFRVAVMILILLGAATVYKFSVTTASDVYSESFERYEIATSRGANEDGALEKAYRNKYWKDVVNLFAAKQDKTSKDFFLAGMANMELKNYMIASQQFNQVLQLNKSNSAPMYQDDAEYYLAMSYLASDQPKMAIPILRKIKADGDHLYNKKAKSISDLDLKLLELKR